MSRRCWLFCGLRLAAVILVALGGHLDSTAHATPITGKLSFHGALDLSAAAVDFLPAGGTGRIILDSFTQTGFFAPLASTTGTLLDWTSAAEPVGTLISVADFLTLVALPSAQFTLTLVRPGIFSSSGCSAAPPVAGQTCTPPGTFLNLTNTPDGGSVLFFSISGTVRNTVTNEMTRFMGTFTAPFAQLPYQTVLSILGTGGHLNANYSADLTVTIIPP